ncbi:MAG: hypothetical protein ACYC25_02840 [Paludibacter sp.]
MSTSQAVQVLTIVEIQTQVSQINQVSDNGFFGVIQVITHQAVVTSYTTKLVQVLPVVVLIVLSA